MKQWPPWPKADLVTPSLKALHCLCQLKQRIITTIRPSFAGFLNANFSDQVKPAPVPEPTFGGSIGGGSALPAFGYIQVSAAIPTHCRDTVAAETRLEAYYENLRACQMLEHKKIEGPVIIRLQSHSYTTEVHILSS